MRISKKIYLATAVVSVNSTSLAPYVVHNGFSGNGCGNNTGLLTFEENKIIAEFPDFAANTRESESCAVHLNMKGDLAGQKLAIKTVTTEGYLHSSGGVSFESLYTIFWSNMAEHTVWFPPISFSRRHPFDLMLRFHSRKFLGRSLLTILPCSFMGEITTPSMPSLRNFRGSATPLRSHSNTLPSVTASASSMSGGALRE
jgi:hypothetical protein